jgi:hypothetical protein
MKLMGSEAPTRTAAGNRPQRPAIEADRPTFSLALTVPIAWEILAAPPGDELLDRLERSNGAVLSTLLKGVDLGAPPIDDETLAEALEPLRIKLDMVVEMVARLFYRDQMLPPPRRIELGLGHILWSQSGQIQPDAWLLNKVYFSDLFRESVNLIGRVKSCVAAPGNGGWNIQVDLVAMAEHVSESFARLMFLEHRRQLAHHAAGHATERRR